MPGHGDESVFLRLKPSGTKKQLVSGKTAVTVGTLVLLALCSHLHINTVQRSYTHVARQFI